MCVCVCTYLRTLFTISAFLVTVQATGASQVKSSSSSVSAASSGAEISQVDGAAVLRAHRGCCTGSPTSARRASRSLRAVPAASLSFSRASTSLKHLLTSSLDRPPVLRHSGLDEKRPSTRADNQTSANQRSMVASLNRCGRRCSRKRSARHVSPSAQRSAGLEYVTPSVSCTSRGRQARLAGFSSCVAIASRLELCAKALASLAGRRRTTCLLSCLHQRNQRHQFFVINATR